MWDLAENDYSITLVDGLLAAGKPVAAVCHAPAVLRHGGNYSKAEDWQPHVVTDGLLITGQNPASSEPAAKALLNLLM